MKRFLSAQDAAEFIEQHAVAARPAESQVPPAQRQEKRMEETRALFKALGSPQFSVPVAHITGTSGKGSASVFLAAILQAQGLRVCLYTNPYIICPQERIQIDGRYISDELFIELAEKLADVLERFREEHPTFIPHIKQLWTAMAFLAAEAVKADIFVAEVGMGGRFDETNVAQPQVCVITTIGFDHMEFLGADLAHIAWHKAGIIKRGIPVVTGANDSSALAVIKQEAETQAAPLLEMNSDFGASEICATAGETTFTYTDYTARYERLRLRLTGAFQARNAALAICAAKAARPEISEDAIRTGLLAAWLPGRFEIVRRNPYVILDAAHNPEKMRACLETLRLTIHPQKTIIIFGALGSKAILQMLEECAALNPLIIAAEPKVTGRISAPANQISAAAAQLGLRHIIAGNAEDAVRIALENAAEADAVLITGSLFLVSNLRAYVLQTVMQNAIDRHDP